MPQSTEQPLSSATNPGCVFLVEDDQALRTSICEVLRFVGYRVQAYANPQEFLHDFTDIVPAVLVTDVRMPGMSGVDLQEKLLSHGRQMPIIFISGESTVSEAVKAMSNGAFEFLLKPFSRESLLSAVSKALALDAQLMRDLIKQVEFEQKLKALSPREREVFKLMTKGYGNAELANELGVALSTVKEYKSEMMYKLRLRSLSELIALSETAERRSASKSDESPRSKS
jgi:FixJ family two-component response regulator